MEEQMKEYLYKFEDLYTRDLISSTYKRLKLTFNKIFIRLILSSLILLILGFLNDINIIKITSAVILILSIILIGTIYYSFRIVERKLVESSILNSTMDVTIFDDHLFIYHNSTDKESKHNIQWKEFKAYDEYKDVMILTNHLNQIYMFSKKSINNLEAENFIKNKLLDHVKMFCCKRVKKNKPISYYIKK